mmetsp:Transcript_20005/g.36175  ORF Transcript_20005/g.36175 Transcript_20005/m.36175 type:complete len:224 (+) Transcript_20005:161-832(+)
MLEWKPLRRDGLLLFTAAVAIILIIVITRLLVFPSPRHPPQEQRPFPPPPLLLFRLFPHIFLIPSTPPHLHLKLRPDEIHTSKLPIARFAITAREYTQYVHDSRQWRDTSESQLKLVGDKSRVGKETHPSSVVRCGGRGDDSGGSLVYQMLLPPRRRSVVDFLLALLPSSLDGQLREITTSMIHPQRILIHRRHLHVNLVRPVPQRLGQCLCHKSYAVSRHAR